MILCELLQRVTYDQILIIYLSNDYDQNLLIGQGTRQELLNDTDEELFFHLMDKVQLVTVTNNKSLFIKIENENHAVLLENQYSDDYVKRWKREDPETRPFRFSCELGNL